MNSRSNSRTLAFIVFSVLAHIGIAISVMNMKAKSELNPESKPESASSVEISTEFSAVPEMSVAEAPNLADIAQKAEEKTTAVEIPAPLPATPVAEEKSAPAEPEPMVVAPPPVAKKSLPPKKAKQPSLPAKKATSDSEQKTSSTETQENSPVVVPLVQTVDAQQAESDNGPESTTPPTAAAPVEEAASEAQAEMDRQAEEALMEQERQTALLQRQAEEEKLRLEQQALLARQQAEAQAAALEAEKEKARQKAEQEAEQARLAQAARMAEEARIAAAAAKASEGSGFAAGSSGSSSSDEVRALEDLRQMPGNKRPQYDSDDRFHGRQGEVSFKAYVSREGAITDFKLTKSSGHRQLDAKTLKALKSWKFYPGQEGWVEIPFQWDLKGEPKEKPTTLRVKSQVSQNGG